MKSGMKEGFLKRIAIGALCIVMMICMLPAVKPVDALAAANYNAAITWAKNIANDNSHGYSQKNRWGNPDFDCSSFVISAFKKSGYNVGSATYTGNMKRVFTKNGFTWIPKAKINLSNSNALKPGDILLNEANHTELYIGNGKMVGAHYDVDGRAGDSTGREISVISYSNRSNWDGVLRPNAASNKKPNVRLHVWVSKKPMGNQATALFVDDWTTNDMYYLCYEVLNADTGKRLSGQQYKATETIFDPSGKKVHTHTYANSNNNWIGYRALKKGKYRGVVTLSGGYNTTCTVSFDLIQPKVKPNLWFSHSSMGKSITSAKEGKAVYVCFQFKEGHSNKLFNQTVTKKYRHTLYIYDGTKQIYSNLN